LISSDTNNLAARSAWQRMLFEYAFAGMYPWSGLDAFPPRDRRRQDGRVARPAVYNRVMLHSASLRLAAVVLASPLLFAAEAPPPASAVVESAQSAAASQHKSVFLIFHASWCVWCRNLDRFIEAPEIKAVIDKYFVVARLTVLETGDKKPLDNPGGGEAMTQVGGAFAGLPFFAFLDETGKTIVNSIRPGEGSAATRNIGHPAQPQEVDWFLVMVRKAAPGISPDEVTVLDNWLRAQKK